jgi:hypothetical protein
VIIFSTVLRELSIIPTRSSLMFASLHVAQVILL